MGKILVLAEKPSVGRELARVLGCHQKKDGCIIGDKYIVTWALGHLVTLADPEHYSEKYKTWNLESLPMLPPKMDLVVMKETGKQFTVVKNLMKGPGVDEVIIATDAGREGELVARWIIEKVGFKKPIKRLWISSQTDKAIKEGFQKLRPSKEYDALYQSAVCRAEADWLVGLNITRALTCKYNAQLSAGRVQTPTLAMIVARENEIKKFVPKDYYTISIHLDGFKVNWQDKNNQTRISDVKKAEAIVKQTAHQTMQITEVKKEEKKELPPLLYDLTELQRDANRKYGYSAKRTLDLMQQLYEYHKLLTYPRTDSKFLSTDIVPTLAQRLKCINFGEYGPYAMEIIRRGVVPTKRFVDNAKVSDHHAIIPTDEFANISVLNIDERKIYDLVVKRFIAALGQDFKYEQTTVKGKVGEEIFTAKGKIVKAAGWKAIYGTLDSDQDDLLDISEKDQMLPNLVKGDTRKVLESKLHKGQTKPSARYNEATLLSAMEYPGKFIEDDNLKSIIDTAKGIGTSATRADIIEKLFSSNYVERRGKDIFPLSKGIQLIGLVPEALKSPELTATWEERLDKISKGKENGSGFMSEIRTYAQSLVGQVIASNASYTHDNMTKNRCPVCDKFLLEINGKKGKMLVCPDRECGYKKGLVYNSNARCPNCHKKMEVYGEGEKRIYRCGCGFREKYDKFNQFLKENSNKSDKREVHKYMEKQKEESKNELSAFAIALAKANEKNK